jgi:RecA/RadA recombinase
MGRPKGSGKKKEVEIEETAPSDDSGGAAARSAVSRSRLDKMAKVLKSVSSIKQASDFVQDVSVVPTIFPMFDCQHVGGLPIGKLILVQGPSANGKSPYAIGLGRSFVEKGHFFNFIDAERATPAKWLRSLMGEYYDYPTFTVPEKIGTYEDVRAHVRQWCEAIGDARESGDIDPDTTGVIVLDSLKKLVPKNMMEELGKSFGGGDRPKRGPGAAKGHVDGMGGRGGQIKAGYNAAWVDELVPLLADTRTTMVMITRETVEEGEGFFAKETYTAQGGRHIKYDSSMWLRIVDSPVYQKVGDDEKAVVGHRHTIEILRSKVKAMHDRVVRTAYHTSNGVICPEGFDRVRDVLELSLDTGVLEMKGAYYVRSDDGESLGQGEAKTLERLRSEPALVQELETKCREKFNQNPEVLSVE